MTKKIFSAMFVAASMLLATSCTSDEFTTTQSGDQATVSFSLGLEGGIDTRAISDGSGADVLQYAVFDQAGDRISTIAKVSKTGVTFPTTENITLAKGQTYKIAFWAQDADCQAYTVSDDMNVAINYAGVNNDETRDAFFKSIEFTVTGSTSIDVILKRPFAQINVGVYESDWNAAVASGVEIEKSTANIVKAANTINLLTGKVGEETTDVTVGYTENAIPTEALMVDLDKNGTKEAYKWLSMSYILVADHGTTANAEGMYGAAATTLEDLGFSFIPKAGNAITFAQGLKSVPVQRNWRTNIIGKLLTGDITFNIDIDPIYDGEYIYPEGPAQQLEMAAATGGAVTLNEDVALDKPLVVQGDMIINLNGHTITGNWAKSVGHVIKVNEGASLNISGGTVKSTGNNGGSAIYNDGTLTVEDATIVGASVRENGGWPSYPVNNYSDMTIKNTTITGYQGVVACSAAGTTVIENCIFNKEYLNTSSHTFYINHAEANVIVNGGTYTHNGMDGSLAYVNAGTFTVNEGEFTAGNGGYGIAPLTNGTVIINGGTFNNALMNWGGNITVTGGKFKSDPTAFIAAGYKSVKNGDKFYVVAENVKAVASTEAEIKNAAAAGGTIVVAAGEYTFPASSIVAGTTLVCEEGTVFQGKTSLNINGATVEGATFENNSGDVLNSGTVNGTFKNCKFIGSGNALRNAYAGETVVFEDCEFSGSVYGIHFDGGANDVIFRNCVTSGFNALGAALTMVTFEGCTFKGNGISGYNGANLWGSAKMINCEFTFDGSTANEWIDCIGLNKTYEFENCTVNGVAYTKDNYTTAPNDNIFSRNHHPSIKINGVACAF